MQFILCLMKKVCLLILTLQRTFYDLESKTSFLLPFFTIKQKGFSNEILKKRKKEKKKLHSGL